MGRHPFARIAFFESGDEVVPTSAEVIHPRSPSGPGQDSLVTVLRHHESDTHWFCYADGCRFRIDGTGLAVAAYRPPGLSIDDLWVYLLGPIMGFALRLQGVVTLHASAVVLDGQAVAFVGAGGAGKSTLAARFALGGIPIITDDVLPLHETAVGFAVRPSVPHVKLWPDSVERLYGRPDALPKLVPSSPDWDKRGLDLTPPGAAFAGADAPLRQIYLLEPRSPMAVPPRIARMEPAEALLALIAHAYVNYALSREMREYEFGVLSRLIQTVPVARLSLPEAIGNLDELIAALRVPAVRG